MCSRMRWCCTLVMYASYTTNDREVPFVAPPGSLLGVPAAESAASVTPGFGSESTSVRAHRRRDVDPALAVVRIGSGLTQVVRGLLDLRLHLRRISSVVLDHQGSETRHVR